MSDWNLQHEVIKEGLSLCGAIATLAAGWLVGRRLSYRWDVRQKRRDLQLSASQQFYTAYGEFFATWKLWNRSELIPGGTEDRRWELHKRAAAAEAIVEGILVKLSSELQLSDEELRTLGSYRQAFQQLRQSIRGDRKLNWDFDEHPQYAAFKVLSTRVAGILAREWSNAGPSDQAAAAQIRKITSNVWERRWTELD
jgi:hypothetical protein